MSSVSTQSMRVSRTRRPIITHGSEPTQRRDLRAGHPRGDEDQALGAVLQQRLEHRLLAPAPAAAGDEQQPVAEV